MVFFVYESFYSAYYCALAQKGIIDPRFVLSFSATEVLADKEPIFIDFYWELYLLCRLHSFRKVKLMFLVFFTGFHAWLGASLFPDRENGFPIQKCVKLSNFFNSFLVILMILVILVISVILIILIIFAI